MTVNSFYGPNTYGTNETPTQGETVKATVSGGWTEYNNKTLYPEGGMYAYLADVTITPSRQVLKNFQPHLPVSERI